MDIDSRQHQFDPPGTKLPVVPRGPDSALGWHQVTLNMTAIPVHGLTACAVAILMPLKQRP